MIYTLRTLRRAIDRETGAEIPLGGLIITKDYNRAESCIRQGICELVSARREKSKSGAKIIIYCSYLAEFGGIETATEELVKHFGRKVNMELVVNVTKPTNLLHLSQYVNIKKDDGGELAFGKDDVLILVNYDTASILNRITKWPKKIYQQNHAVWDKLPNLDFSRYIEHKSKIDAVLSVSEDARRGFKARYGLDSVIVPNIISRPDEALIFGFFSRSSAEKGFDTIMPAIQKFRTTGKPFYFLIATSPTNASDRSLNAIKFEKEVILVPSGKAARGMIHMVDYLWQLSTTESMGLSVYEAMLSGVPAICSKIPAFKEIVEHGKNGYLVEHDLSDLPVDEIFDRKISQKKQSLIDEKKLKPSEEMWNKVFRGEL